MDAQFCDEDLISVARELHNCGVVLPPGLKTGIMRQAAGDSVGLGIIVHYED